MKRFLASVLLATLTLPMILSSCSKSGGKQTVTTAGAQTTAPGTTQTTTGPQITTPESTTEIPTTEYVPDPSNPLSELFLNPTLEFRWNTIEHGLVNTFLSNGSFGSTLLSLKKRGIGGFVTNITWDSKYIDSDNHFENLSKMAVDILLVEKMNLWLYDELGYPSGSAGGRTAKDNPEYNSLGLVMIKKKGEGKNPITVSKTEELMRFHKAYAVDDNGNTILANVTDNEVSFSGTSGNWILYIFAVKPFIEGTHAVNSGWEADKWVSKTYINLMDKDAVAAFINNTYKPYAEKFKYFDQVVGVFTDEPSLMEPYQNTKGGQSFKYAQLSWCDDFDARFEKMHGYSITDKYHMVFSGDTTEAKIIRTNYRQTVGEMVSENYFGQINEFCEENGSKLSGHLLLEEGIQYHAYYYGDLMQCVRKMGIPGVDSLNGNDFTFMEHTFMAVKYATSATTLEGKDRMTMVELCATDFKLSPYTKTEMKKLWNTVNLMFFEGITNINSYVRIEALFPYHKTFFDYFARLAVLSRNSVWDGDIAVYYPINTFQAYSTPNNREGLNSPPDNCINRVALTLYDKKLDFTVADNEFILEAEIKNGTLTNGKVSFKAICMPGVEVMPLEVLKKLKAFEAEGGLVYWINSVPTLPDKLDDIEEFSSLVAGYQSVTTSAMAKALTKEISYGVEATSNIYVGKYTLDGAPMRWVFNRGDKDRTVTVKVENAVGYNVYDPLTGIITYIDGNEIEYEIPANNACLFVAKIP